jgi:hypothetical protein
MPVRAGEGMVMRRRFLSTLKRSLVLGFLLGIPTLGLSAPPAEKILVIYYADSSQTCASGAGGGAGPFTYPQQLMQAVTTAIGPLASQVQLLAIHSGDKGIATELNTQYSVSSLSQWCQVYDLRFLDQCNNQGYTGSQFQADLVTGSGANNDQLLYQNYLAQGGSLFLQGEHHDFYVRNNGMLQFINTVASTQVVSAICSTYICPDVNTATPLNIVNPFTANYGFNTVFNNLSGATSISGWYTGGIAAANYGSGQPLITVPSLSYSGTSGALMLGWEGSALQGRYSAGKLVESFETNAFIAPQANTWSTQALQNLYALLSGCQHYTVSKAFNQSSLCVGASGSFTLCGTNTSAAATLTNFSLSDTLPTCLTYTGSTSTGTSSTGNAGSLYWWTYPAVPPGSSVCVTVQFNVSNNACP